MRIFILGNGHKTGVQNEVERLLSVLEKQFTVEVCDLFQQEDLSEYQADVALVFGGDGAILRAVRQMGYQQLPVLGFNLGKLGFLADVGPEEMHECCPQLLAQSFHVTHHLMYECLVKSPSGTTTHLGLNEIAIHSGPPFTMTELDLFINDELVSSFRGDGLIISTPIGSTAYSLSAGGPILHQELKAFVVTQICPHQLTNRPLVDTADKTYTIRIRPESSTTMLMIDGHEMIELTPENEVIVQAAPVTFQLIKMPNSSYYRTLSDKLHWGAPPNYRLHDQG